jgi:O-antigen/teichoic acid export membrane protein
MLIAYAIMIPKYGDLGAAWATFIGFAFYACLNMYAAYKIIPVVYEVRRMATVMAIATLIYLCSTLLGLGTMEFFIKLALCISFPTAVWFLVSDKEEKEFAWQNCCKAVQFVADRRRG